MSCSVLTVTTGDVILKNSITKCVTEAMLYKYESKITVFFKLTNISYLDFNPIYSIYDGEDSSMYII